MTAVEELATAEQASPMGAVIRCRHGNLCRECCLEKQASDREMLRNRLADRYVRQYEFNALLLWMTEGIPAEVVELVAEMTIRPALSRET